MRCRWVLDKKRMARKQRLLSCGPFPPLACTRGSSNRATAETRVCDGIGITRARAIAASTDILCVGSPHIAALTAVSLHALVQGRLCTVALARPYCEMQRRCRLYGPDGRDVSDGDCALSIAAGGLRTAFAAMATGRHGVLVEIGEASEARDCRHVICRGAPSRPHSRAPRLVENTWVAGSSVLIGGGLPQCNAIGRSPCWLRFCPTSHPGAAYHVPTTRLMPFSVLATAKHVAKKATHAQPVPKRARMTAPPSAALLTDIEATRPLLLVETHPWLLAIGYVDLQADE